MNPPPHTHTLHGDNTPTQHTQVGTHGMFRTRGAVDAVGQLQWRPFHHTLEDVYGAVAQYYALPTLSLR